MASHELIEVQHMMADLTGEVSYDFGAETVFVWERETGGPGGFISLSLRPWAEGCVAEPVPYIEGWWVAPDLRGSGVGRALVNAAEHWCRVNGFPELGSDVHVENARSLRAHLALGFEPTMRLQFFRKILNILVVITCFAAWSCADSPAPANPDALVPSSEPADSTGDMPLAGMFAFANETGTELLALQPSAAPDSYTAAVCGAGRFRVRYVRTQGERPESSGRQVAENFGSEAGTVYQIEGGTATPDETCFLTTAALLARIAVPAVTFDPTCQGHHVAHLARLAGRAVLDCWRLAQMDDGSRFLAVLFANVDTSALAGVALARDSVHLFLALPGRYDGQGGSVWRVDDGGVFDPGAIRLLFAARLPQGHAAAFLWAGAEGESDQLVVADSTSHARSVLAAYRYWSPP